MSFRYHWFQIDGDKFDRNKRILQEVTISELKQAIGLYLFNLKQVDELDIIPKQLKNIKDRTIRAYPPSADEEEKWSEPPTEPNKQADWLERVNKAKKSILDMDLLDAVEKYIGEHKIIDGSKDKDLVSRLYLDVDDTNWKVKDIAEEVSHEDFFQPLFTYGKPKLKPFQDRVFDEDDPVNLTNKELKQGYDKGSIDITKSGGLGEHGGDKLIIKFNIKLIDKKVHLKRLRAIFPKQRVSFQHDSKVIKPSKPEMPFKLEGGGTPFASHMKRIGETKWEEKEIKRKDVRSGETEWVKVPLKRKDLEIYDKETKETKDLPDIKDIKAGKKIIARHPYGEKDLEEQVKEQKKRIEASKAKRNLNVDSSSINDAIELFHSPTKENVHKWLEYNWDNNALYHHFQIIGMPMSLTSIGDYKITLIITRKEGERDISITSDWLYTQNRILTPELLMNPSGSQGERALKFKFGKKRDTTQPLTMREEKDRRKRRSLGYNPQRKFLATHVTSRLAKLEEAIGGAFNG